MKRLQSCRVAGLAALLVAAAAPARAQQVQLDPRWQAWLGCWEPVTEPATAQGGAAKLPLICVIPAAGTSGVDVLTVVDSEVVARDSIVVTGERRDASREGCTGWESAQWASEGQRVYLRSEYSCPGGLKRSTSGLIAMSPAWEWLDVQGVTAHGGTGVRVLRYHTAAVPALPGEVSSAFQGRAYGAGLARAAAAAPFTAADVVEASRQVDAAVVEAWLAEQGQGFAIDAKRLVELAGQGVPDRVIDVMVALSYPKVFAVNPASTQGGFAPVGAGRRAPAAVADTSYADRWAQRPWGYYSRYGWVDCSPISWSCYSLYGWGPWYGGGYGRYYGGGTVVIVTGGGAGGGGGDGGGAPTQPHGRVVNGRGYVGGQGSSGEGALPRPSPNEGWSGSSASGHTASSPSSGSSSSSSSSSSSGSGRTAHPRSP